MNTTTTTNTRDIWKDATLDDGRRVLIMTANLDAFGDVRTYNAVTLDADGSVVWGTRSFEVSTYRVEFDVVRNGSRFARFVRNEWVTGIAFMFLLTVECALTLLSVVAVMALLVRHDIATPVIVLAMFGVFASGVFAMSATATRGEK